jgi:hypothetical protein
MDAGTIRRYECPPTFADAEIAGGPHDTVAAMILLMSAFLICSSLGPTSDSASVPPPNVDASAANTITIAQSHDRQRAKRRFIGGGVLLGLAFVGEMAGAGVTHWCWQEQRCKGSLSYTWGSERAGSRFTLFTAGPGNAYVGARILSAPLVLTGGALLLGGAHARAYGEPLSTPSKLRRADIWVMLGTGLGVYVASRLARLGFAVGGVCQQPGCVLAFDQFTLGASRALMLTGGSFLLHDLTRERLRVRLGIGPTMGWGLALHGLF